MADSTILITGGASGIGAAIVRTAFAEFENVFFSDIQDDLGEKLAVETGATYLNQDVSNEKRWKEVMAEIVSATGRLDALINNAGIFLGGCIEDTEMDLWMKMIAVNQTGTMLGCREAISVMKENPGGPKGSIVNMSSITGFIGLANGAAYGATKGAVRLLSKSIAVHCAKEYKDIRCNSVHPGAIDTPMNQAAFEASGDAAGTRAFFETLQPIGRMGTSEEIANGVMFLASDKSSFVTGTELLIDGGWLAASGPL
ncbi:SDR family oxidoreductase [Litorimonas haliclonae]|uniref:SDR family oxidoreductase n=1 Tax=Litorimonas haliclonae TaxID=2081977 RepID=UPI0039EE2566